MVPSAVLAFANNSHLFVCLIFLSLCLDLFILLEFNKLLTTIHQNSFSTNGKNNNGFTVSVSKFKKLMDKGTFVHDEKISDSIFYNYLDNEASR